MSSDVERTTSLSVLSLAGERSLAEHMPRRRYLPEIHAEPHVAGTRERVAEALQRVTTREFTVAIDALNAPEVEIGHRVDAAIPALQRVESLLRLVRAPIGSKRCAAELRILRDARRFLAGLVAGRGEIRSLDELRLRYDTALRPEALSALREELLDRHQILRLEQLPALQPGGELAHWIHQLQRARARFAAWPVDERIHGQTPLPDSFDAFAEGIHRTYRKGAKRADDTHANLEKWHRDARDLAHQVELLSGAWPEVLSGTVATASDLAAVLAEHGRLRSLRKSVVPEKGRTVPTLTVDDVTAAVVESLCDHESHELRSIAAVLGARLYAEAPDDFTNRLERYWSTRP